MAYTVQSTERVRGIAADYETKAMLYLMGGRDDSHEIYSFAIDFFNDVTGLSCFADKAWDVQSKGTKISGPKEVGKELVTLFKNYMSDLHFDFLILFMASVPATLRVDSTQNTFGAGNINEAALERIKEGLKEEASERSYIREEWITDNNVDAFLEKVVFVVDVKTKAEYIRDLLSLNPHIIPSDRELESIFNNIRNVQSAKKENKTVEGTVVNHLRDVWKYDRNIKTKEVRMMVVNSIVNHDFMRKSIPSCFYPVIENYDEERRRFVVEDCRLKLVPLFFDKQNAEVFWDLLETIIVTIQSNPELNVIEIFGLLADHPSVKNPRLDILSVEYLISIMKEALQC